MRERTATIGTLLAILAAPCAIAEVPAEGTHYAQRTEYRAPGADAAPVVDGVADESAWSEAPWQPINVRWLGPVYTPEDFEGRYKVVWTPERIFMLVEIVDDILIDAHRDPLVRYWDDDTLEIFVDEDYSGGEHRFNHNAFAYHFSLDNRAIDLSTSEKPRDYSHHVDSAWKQSDDKIVWEVAIDIYADDYVDGSPDNAPVKLEAGNVMGLMVAYCDNDGSELRENFIGSEIVLSGPTDRGYIDAGLFGSLTLEE
ncbi:MAG: CBM9 family sugar-binding protein [Gammaproteobacteria bacterium]|nr:CBM9 family sugar-binding protein [Gammaproteobacteria bacterium]